MKKNLRTRNQILRQRAKFPVFFFSCNCKMRLGIVCDYNEDVNKQKRKALPTLVSASPLFIIVILCREGIYTRRNYYTEMLNISSLYRHSHNAVSLPIVLWLIAYPVASNCQVVAIYCTHVQKMKCSIQNLKTCLLCPTTSCFMCTWYNYSS
jgi:hypothetical protein